MENKNTKQLSVTEYAKLAKKSRSNVAKQTADQRIDLLPGVDKIERVGNVWVLTVDMGANHTMKKYGPKRLREV